MGEATGRRGLGRGLDSLLGPSRGAGGADLRHIALDSIQRNPDQPRRSIDPAGIESLAASIRASGVVQPVLVRPLADGRFELIVGERRWRAARLAGLATIPAAVREADVEARLELGLVENLAREDLNPIEIAHGCATLVEDFGRTHAELAERLGRSRPAVSNLLRLLELPEDVQDLVVSGALTEGHARALLMADGARARRRLAARAVSEGLSVRQVERAAAGPPVAASPSPAAAARVDDDLVDRLAHALGAAARGRAGKRGEILIELRFADAPALARAVERLF